MNTKAFTSNEQFLNFALAGNATFTVRSRKSDTRFTFRVRKPQKCGSGCPHFVSVLTGPRNTNDYLYIGFLNDQGTLIAGHKGKASAPSFQALQWVLKQAHAKQQVHDDLEIYHEGKCGKCGRKLTVPESIELGLGPVCAGTH